MNQVQAPFNNNRNDKVSIVRRNWFLTKRFLGRPNRKKNSITKDHAFFSKQNFHILHRLIHTITNHKVIKSPVADCSKESRYAKIVKGESVRDKKFTSKIISLSNSNLNLVIQQKKVCTATEKIMSKLNSTAYSEDYLLQDIENSVEAIEVDENTEAEIELSITEQEFETWNNFTAQQNENRETTNGFSLTEQEIAEISDSAAKLVVEQPNHKRGRDTSASSGNVSVERPAPKKIKMITMDPLEELYDVQATKYLVRLVPDIKNVHLFSVSHLELIHSAVHKVIKEGRIQTSSLITATTKRDDTNSFARIRKQEITR